jgi:hypothetical protein
MKRSVQKESISIDNKIVGKVDINGYLAYYSITLTTVVIMFIAWLKLGHHVKNITKKITKRKKK